MFESKFELERVFRDFRSLILTSFFHNVWKIWNFHSSLTSKILPKISAKIIEFLAYKNFWSDLDQKWLKLTIFGPIRTQFRSKQLKIWPIGSIESTKLSPNRTKNGHFGQIRPSLIYNNWCKYSRYFWHRRGSGPRKRYS